MSLDIKSVSEFGFYEDGENSFKRYFVKIDQSSDKLSKLTEQSKSDFVERELFLELLVSGKANLYVHRSEENTRFFYAIDSNPIEQLEYKKYLDVSDIYENKKYKQVLYNAFREGGIQSSELEATDYNEASLVKLFAKYNSFFGISNKNESTKKKSKSIDFNMMLRPGVTYSSLKIKSEIPSFGQAEFDSKAGFRFGIELEVMFNKKYCFLIEPTYRTYKSDGTQTFGTQTITTISRSIEYNSIEIPLSIRRYFFISNNVSFFANLSAQADILVSDSYQESAGFELRQGLNFAAGIGLMYNSKYFVELNYDTPRSLTERYTYLNSKFNSVSLIFGYKLF